MNKTLAEEGRNILKKLLPLCTEAQQVFFKRMYSSEPEKLTVEETIDNIPPEKINWAISQVEKTIMKNEGS